MAMTLRKRLAIVVVALMSGFVAAYSAMLLGEVPSRARAEQMGTLPWVLALLPDRVEPVGQGEQATLAGLVRLVGDLRDIRHVTVILRAADGTLLAEAPARRAPSVPGWLLATEGETAPVIKDVSDGRGVVARFEVGAGAEDELSELWEDFLRSVALVAALAICTVSLIVWFTFRALQPLERIHAGLRDVGAGRRAPRLPHAETAEMQEIADAFNRMADDLDAARAGRDALMRKLVEGEERTRRSIAQDLHDELSPYLVALQPLVHTLQRQCAGRDDIGDIGPSVRTLVSHQTHILATVRRILNGLHPPELETLGLRRAIERLVAQRAGAGGEPPSTRLLARGGWTSFGPTLDVSLYRMVQECLTNACRHARPRTIDVSIECRPARAGEPQTLCLDVRNDGVPPSAGATPAPGGGLGTIGLRDRCLALGGEFSSAADGRGGWYVRITIPLTEPANEPPAPLAGVTPT